MRREIILACSQCGQPFHVELEIRGADPASETDRTSQVRYRDMKGAEFQAQLADWRAANGVTQREFAEMVGVSRETVAAWETGATQTRPRNVVTCKRAMQQYEREHGL